VKSRYSTEANMTSVFAFFSAVGVSALADTLRKSEAHGFVAEASTLPARACNSVSCYRKHRLSIGHLPTAKFHCDSGRDCVDWR